MPKQIAREAAKLEGRKYTAERIENGNTLKELLARGRYALFKSPENWTDTQRTRARILFDLYPDLKQAYWLSQNLSKPPIKYPLSLYL